jgi:hypothetical protein
MEFICPIGGPGTPPWHAVVHLGLTGFVVVFGAAFLMLAFLAYSPGRPVEPRGRRNLTVRFVRGMPVLVGRRLDEHQNLDADRGR